VRLLFIPGSGGGKEEWLYQTRYFPNSEAIVFPGHPEGRPCSSVEEYVSWLRDYLRRQQYRDVVLAGHSLGGAIAQRYGLEFGDELGALVLIGTGARLKVLPALLAKLSRLINDPAGWREYIETLSVGIAEDVRQEVIESRVRIGAEVTLNDFLCCDRFDIMDRIHQIDCPTLVICGREDTLTPVKYAHYLTDRISGAREVIIAGAKHWVQLEQPDEVNRAIADFLSRLD
jgi:pimeloyl-ACP methyl ester carboxylesterase